MIGPEGRALGQFQSESLGREVCDCDLSFAGCTRDGRGHAFISSACSPKAGLGRIRPLLLSFYFSESVSSFCQRTNRQWTSILFSVVEEKVLPHFLGLRLPSI